MDDATKGFGSLGEPRMFPNQETIIPPATHMQSLTITTNSPEQWKDVHDSFADMIRIVGTEFPSVSMSSHTLDNDPGVDAETEYYDQYTVVRVQRAMERVGIKPQQARQAIAEMEAAGILFRERTP